MQIILATRNPGKIKEIHYLVEKHHPNSFELMPIPKGISEIDEPYTTYVENALHKARHIASFTNLPVIAEDSGINLPALGGLPGIYSSRFCQLNNPVYINQNSTDQDNNQKLLSELNKITTPNSAPRLRAAYYFCAAVFIRNKTDHHPIISQGVWHGSIGFQEVGSNGFGYDPLFWLDEINKTAAELSLSEKSNISHRAIAITKLLSEIKILRGKQSTSDN